MRETGKTDKGAHQDQQGHRYGGEHAAKVPGRATLAGNGFGLLQHHAAVSMEASIECSPKRKKASPSAAASDVAGIPHSASLRSAPLPLKRGEEGSRHHGRR